MWYNICWFLLNKALPTTGAERLSMNTNLSLIPWVAGISLAFVIWPLLAKVSGVSGAWVGILVLAGSFIGNLVVGAKDISTSPMFTMKAFMIMMVAGIINGVAVYYYGMKAADPSITTWILLTSVTILMAVFSPLVNVIMGGTGLAIQHWIGIFLACGGILVINIPVTK